MNEAERDQIVAEYLMTPNGKHRLRRAMGFHGTRSEFIDRWSKRLHLMKRMLQIGIRVVK